MGELQQNWQEFLKYLTDNRDWHRFVDERGITNQVTRNFQTFMYWMAHNKNIKTEGGNE